jgi:lipopolysaccharide transport system ATP-binding protein
LAFSVATCIRPDILIVDEALSVGDIYFQQKCYERIQGFAAAGTTLLFVSHSMGTIISLCNRAIYLKNGNVEFDGDPKSAVDLYQAELLMRLDKEPQRLQVAAAPPAVQIEDAGLKNETNFQADALQNLDPGSITTQAVEFLGARILSDRGPTTVVVTDQQVVLELSYRLLSELKDPHVGFKVRNQYGTVLYETNSYCLGTKPQRVAVGVAASFRFSFHARLAPGEYTITAGFAEQGYDRGSFERVLNFQHGVLAFQVVEDVRGARWTGLINLDATFESTEERAAGS